ncbi:MAG TPA: MBL fold metallo-hydrolase, partial [Acidimicrobiales bacterium]
MKVTTLGTGWPLPDATRAGASNLVEAGGQRFLVDTGRGVLMRLAATGAGMGQVAAVFLTHLHSDHVSDFNDVVTTSWIGQFTPGVLKVIGPPG